MLTQLNNFVNPRKLGIVTGADGMVRLFPGLVRIPDVAYASRQHLPGGRFPKEPIPSLILAVEVLSESNTVREMDRKRGEYFKAGVRLAWMVDPATRKIFVYQSPQDHSVLSEGDTLTGDPVLPGLAIDIRALFSGIDA